jgi:hypothetical protein
MAYIGEGEVMCDSYLKTTDTFSIDVTHYSALPLRTPFPLATRPFPFA